MSPKQKEELAQKLVNKLRKNEDEESEESNEDEDDEEEEVVSSGETLQQE